jgi:hypothetical protein
MKDQLAVGRRRVDAIGQALETAPLPFQPLDQFAQKP